MTSIDFWVPGIPRTKGSVVAVTADYVKHSDASIRREREIADAAVREIRHRGVRRTVGQSMFGPTFAFAVRYAAFVPLPAGADPHSAAIEDGDRDVDKLPRTVLDALTGVVWTDDVQVVEAFCTKDYAVATGVGEYIAISTVSNHVARRMRHEVEALTAVERSRGVGRPIPIGW